MNTTHNVIVAFLALIFVISGLSKASGNEKGLSGTREVNVKDWMARLIGVVLWVTMAGAIYFHFRANKPKTAFPAFFLLTLLSVAIVTI